MANMGGGQGNIIPVQKKKGANSNYTIGVK